MDGTLAFSNLMPPLCYTTFGTENAQYTPESAALNVATQKTQIMPS